jgi:hypothetical protein
MSCVHKRTNESKCSQGKIVKVNIFLGRTMNQGGHLYQRGILTMDNH